MRKREKLRETEHAREITRIDKEKEIKRKGYRLRERVKERERE